MSHNGDPDILHHGNTAWETVNPSDQSVRSKSWISSHHRDPTDIVHVLIPLLRVEWGGVGWGSTAATVLAIICGQ